MCGIFHLYLAKEKPIKFHQNHPHKKEELIMQFCWSGTSVLWSKVSLKKIACLLFPALILTAVFAAPKAEFWESKAFDEWSLKECQKLLQDSPWAKNYQLTSAQSIGGLSGGDATDGQPPYVTYQVQLRSAHPIRQAMIRQMQIAQNYEKMSVEQKKQFDQSSQSFLMADTSNVVIVYLSYKTNLPNNYRDLSRYWQTQTVELLNHSVYLSGSKGDKVPIAQYIPGQEGGNDFQFIFPRKVNGKEVLGPDDKELRLEFAYPVVGRIGDGRGFIEFKVDKMKVNGEAVY
jgi:hypothetical protein